MAAYRVLVFAPMYPPAYRGGGPIRSIHVMVRNASDDIAVSLVASDRDLGTHERLPVNSNVWTRRDNADVFYVSAGSVRRFVRALFEVRRRRPDLIHLNSVMNAWASIAPLMLWKVGFFRRTLLLMSPRGEFGAAALTKSALRKRVYMRVFRLLRLHRDVIWHSTAPHETRSIIAMLGDDIRILERGNDTSLALRARHIHPPASQTLQAVFLGRLVEHKGVHIALEALAGVSSSIDFHVYGASEQQDYADRCESLALALPDHIRVYFHGSVPPEDVVDVLAAHDVMLMPTAGENFGHVIAEALSASCVVVTTPETPWTQILLDGGGVVAERSAAVWARELQHLASESSSDRRARRESAGQAYEAWARRPREPHIWEQVRTLAK